MKTIAVILSGCGVQDGSEIHEAVLTLLAIEQAGARYQCLAPNIAQHQVVDHSTGKPVANEKRNVLQEAARIARGKILDIAQAKPADYDAMIFPGGYGAALNLCDFAHKGSEHSVQKDVLHFAQAMVKAGKPAGFICIAPVLISKIYGKGVQLTIGNDAETAQTLEKMGARHINCSVQEIVIDEQHKVVTTPAYMLAQSITQAQAGIDKLVHKVIKMI